MPKYPEGMRWCKVCAEFRPVEKFGPPGAFCYEHWLIHNREKGQKYNKDHPGYNAARAKRWRDENPEKVREKNAELVEKERAVGWPSAKAWYRNKKAEDPEGMRQKWRDYDARWRRENPEKHAARQHRQRARKIGAPGHHTGEDLLRRSELFDDCCVYCGGVSDTWDHLISLRCGGTNFEWNMVPACRSCNSHKQDKDPRPFIAAAPKGFRRELRKSLRRGEEFEVRDDHIRRRYEKVPLGCLMDELRRIARRDGLVSRAALSSSRYDLSTYLRRLGSMEEINRIVGCEWKDGRERS